METLDEATRDEFEKGYFTIQKTRHQFSVLATVQAHEQLNVIVKAVSGPIGELFNTPELAEWGITVPVLSAMTKEAFDTIGVNVVSDEFFQEHHENTDNFESDFRNDCKMLLDAFEHFRNPFTMLCETNTLINIVTGRMSGAEAVQSVFDAKRIGIAQATLFYQQWVRSDDVSIHGTVRQNKLSLFRTKVSPKGPTMKQKLQLQKRSAHLFKQLFLTCKERGGDRDIFFKHEKHDFPPSIENFGNLLLRKNKGEMLRAFDEYRKDTRPAVDALIIDGAAFVNMMEPKHATTYGNYALELSEKILNLTRTLARLDVVFDVYREDSLKAQTREERGEGDDVDICATTPIMNFRRSLRGNRSKSTLFSLLANTFIEVTEYLGKY